MKKNIYNSKPSICLGIFTFVILMATSCKKDCKSSDCFDRKTMLTDIGNQVIIPAFLEFKTNAQLLETEAQTFVTDPDETGLLALQNRWKETAYSIKKIELFKNGPVNQGLFYPSIDFWPVREIDINNYFNNATNITSAELTSKGSTVKGSPVIEYQIFDKANGNISVIARFTSASDANKRKDYLIALTQNLNAIAQQIYNSWNGDYIQTFIDNDGTDINSSANSLVNEILALEDYAKGMKIGAPSGKKDGNLYPQNTEAYQSGESINFVKKNLEVLENTFKGGSGQGLDDYLNFVGAGQDGILLSEKIISQFAVCNTKCNAIHIPLSDAATQQPAAVNELYTELQKLLVFLKVDMVNNLGITITLNDNDGD